MTGIMNKRQKNRGYYKHRRELRGNQVNVHELNRKVVSARPLTVLDKESSRSLRRESTGLVLEGAEKVNRKNTQGVKRKVDEISIREENVTQKRGTNIFDEYGKESKKIRTHAMISLLYSGKQCGSCGLRFTAAEKTSYSDHLDWHFKENRRKKTARGEGRIWYFSKDVWVRIADTGEITGKQSECFEAEAKAKLEGERNRKEKEIISVPCRSSSEQDKCFVCYEKLDIFFHDKLEEWHLKDAVQADGMTFHSLCYPDYIKHGCGNLSV